MRNEIDLDYYHKDWQRVNDFLGSVEAVVPPTPENISRNRLLRVRRGLQHLILDVIPQITDEQQRREVYLWNDGIYTITRVEKADTEVKDA